ncbi:hypothetical protein T4E_6030 [Trichinella pseudospiralis]|uniref:Uncharacterized protein n=1 Tax=Trichinella pseudospiralis TaxID=6337 RepID=A0A0V0Y5D6_TRIPS|nr:hypothetical protein T4E_6030 [Trichinella pseudospiralis]
MLCVKPGTTRYYEKKRFKNEVKFDGKRNVVKLPWKSPEVRILNNYEQSERRLEQLEKKLTTANGRRNIMK